MEIRCTVAVIGAGPAGLAAACAAKEAGAERVIIIERDKSPGGILQQCIHPGFGLVYFKKELTGPEYGLIFIDKALTLGVEFLFGTMVIALGNDGSLECVSPDKGVFRVIPGATVLAMGCRERTRGNIRIPGTRPAGVYTAGTAQRLINRQNCMVGKRFMILGSGDIGMIMARRL
jgi:NADPH-dependent 2,4-dienoyl-CoA reductase/sulfur reductase-like enzyme